MEIFFQFLLAIAAAEAAIGPSWLLSSREFIYPLSVYGQLSLEHRFRFGLNRKRKTEHLTTYLPIELSMIICVIASTIPGISMNPIIEIAQDTLF